MKNNFKFRRLWILPLLLSPFLSAFAIEIDGVQYAEQNPYSGTSSSQIILGEAGKNYYYEFTNSTIELDAGKGAAIEILGNVVIGVNGYLKVKGGDANGYIGAGAGIHVPKGSTLTIMPAVGQSSCTVTANGGNAGEPNVIVSNYSIWLKYNNGAGGAGAGIGGNGGNGGNTEGIIDSNGKYTNCQYGLPSEACGNIVVEKGVTLTAVGGRGTGVAHDKNGTTVYNFDVVSQEHNPINHGYVPAGVNSNHPNTYPSGETSTYEGDTWSTSNYARGSVGGQGGGGGGYPAAGIGGGGSGGGAGGFGTYASEQYDKATALGHGGNAGGGGTGYGKAGEYGFGGGYCRFGFGMESALLVTCIEDAYGEGGHREDKSNKLYSGSNGYWGQKNFTGTGHAAGGSGSTQLDGVRPGTYLDGGKGGPVVSGSDVKEAGFTGGGVLFDSQCGDITIRGNVTSLGNGGHQPKQFQTIGSVTYTEANKPYYINDIGTALNGEHNPFNVIVDGGTLSTHRQDGLTMSDANNFSAKEYTITVTRWARLGTLLYSPPPEKKTVRVSGIQHWKETFGGTSLYFSFIGLEQGKEHFVYANPLPEKRHGAHTDNISVAERYYSDMNLPSADWSYTTAPSWTTVTNATQNDYGFNGRVDTSTSEDRLGIFKFNANIHGGTLDFAGQQIAATNGTESKSLLLSTNRFQTIFHRTSSDGGCDLSWMSWTPLSFPFSGQGGRDYTLQEVKIDALPDYVNNNTDGTRIFGFYTEAATDDGEYQQINGETYSSIAKFAGAGYGDIHVVTWDPARELISPESRDKLSARINVPKVYANEKSYWTSGVWEKGADDNHHIMAKLDGQCNGITVDVKAESQMWIGFSYKGIIWVKVGDSEKKYESGDWATLQIPVEAGEHAIKIDAGYYSTGYLYDFHAANTLALNGIIRTSEDLDAAAELVSKSGGQQLHFRVIGTVETSADFEPIGEFPNYFSGSITGGHIKLTNGKPLINMAMDASFTNVTVSGDINIKDNNDPLTSTFFANNASNCKFTNCKVQGSYTSAIGMTFAGFSMSSNALVFEHCVSDVTVNDHVEIYKDEPYVNKVVGFAIGNDLTMKDCAFTGSLTSTDDNGVVYYGHPFVMKWSSNEDPFQVENCLSTFDPRVDELKNNGITNSYILADAEEQRGNYSTKTAAQFASGEVGYLLAGGGESHWHTPAGAEYPVYDPDNLYVHAHVSADDNIVLSKDSQSAAKHLYMLEGEKFTATHVEGLQCMICHNDELVSVDGTYTGNAPAGESFISVKDFSKAGDEFEYEGLKYVILTEPDGDTPGTVATKPGSKNEANGDVTRGNPGLSGDLVIPSIVYSEGRLFTVTEIGAYSLAGDVTSISLPETLTTIGDEGIHGLNGLTHLYIPASVTSLGNNLYPDHSELVRVEFAEGTQIATIPFSAFQSCNGLTSIVLPETVTSIENFVFFRCANLESVVLSPNTENFGFLPFGEQQKLRTVVYLSENPLSGSSVDFDNDTFTNATLYALASAKEQYQSVNPWKLFANITWCGVILDKETVKIEVGKTETLNATVTLPPSMTAEEIIWSTSDPSVISFNNSEMAVALSSDNNSNTTRNVSITAVGTGSATITATSGKYSADCEVEVKEFTTAIDAIFSDDTVRADIYNFQGICIRRNATRDDVNDLYPGFYIIAGQKIYIAPR